jgi:hypothetical protein
MMRSTVFLLAVLAAPVAAQTVDGTYTFNLLPDPGNMTACIGLEPSFERPFSLVISGGSGVLTSAGGVHLHMSPSSPTKYHGVFELSLERFDYTADLGARTLTVVGNNLGCKFAGKAA